MTKQVLIRLEDQEFSAVERAAKIAGLSKSAWARIILRNKTAQQIRRAGGKISFEKIVKLFDAPNINRPRIVNGSEEEKEFLRSKVAPPAHFRGKTTPWPFWAMEQEVYVVNDMFIFRRAQRAAYCFSSSNSRKKFKSHWSHKENKGYIWRIK